MDRCTHTERERERARERERERERDDNMGAYHEDWVTSWFPSGLWLLSCFLLYVAACGCCFWTSPAEVTGWVYRRSLTTRRMAAPRKTTTTMSLAGTKGQLDFVQHEPTTARLPHSGPGAYPIAHREHREVIPVEARLLSSCKKLLTVAVDINTGLSSVRISVFSHALPPHIVFLTLKKTLGYLMF